MDYTDAQKSQAVKAVKQAKAVIRKKVK